MRRRSFFAALALALLTCGVFGAAVENGFVDWDDPAYVVDNPQVRAGLTPEGVAWAFSTGAAANYHPLTWLSHMLDVELFGLEPAGHHLTSLVLHAASAALLLLFLRAATGRLWPSAVAAALFAVHPLRVESVAWVAERKDVLAGLLAMAVLGLHLWAARKPGGLRSAAVFVAFCAGLMAKSTLVSLPLLLLLLDYWPLGRFARHGRRGSFSRPLLEKLPLVAAAAIFGAVTLQAQVGGGAVTSTGVVPLAVRFGHAAIAYVLYVWKTFVPVGLSFLDLYPEAPRPALEMAGAGALLAVATAAAFVQRRRRPWLLVGWGWFLVALLPVAGLVQAGVQLTADRYTYLPHVGFLCAVVWCAADAVGASGRRAVGGAAIAAVAVVALFAAAAHRQVSFWKDDLALFGRGVDVDPSNWVAHNNFGRALGRQRRTAEAVRHFEEALRLNPGYALARRNLGVARRSLAGTGAASLDPGAHVDSARPRP